MYFIYSGVMSQVRPGFESDPLLRVAFVGCGDHSFRNIYPALRYCPVDLVAVCDRDTTRAQHYRRVFGAADAVADHRDLFELGLDAVFVVTGYDSINGTIRGTHAAIAADLLRSGISTWVEKPPANDLAEIQLLREAIAARRATYAVGYKKAFTPATQHVRTLMQRPEFGALHTMSARYPQPMPSVDEMPDGIEARVFLDHLSHPMSLIRTLGGPTRSISYTRTDDGTGFIVFALESGAIASLHLGPYSYRPGLAERTEVNGDGASITVENNVKVTWYPAGEIAPYGKAADFTAWSGVTQWEPEFSLGQLYNKGLFLLGYHSELMHFCEAVLAGRQVEIGGLDDADEQLRVFAAIEQGPNRVIELADVGVAAAD
jgi:predicted dehydrogenase